MERRENLPEELRGLWDVIVIGGGITGAGLLLVAARAGLRCLLLEQRDFGWGTSSRSGKLVHGGLRYLKQGQIKTTWHSVREREKLLIKYEGLVEPLGFIMPVYRKDRLGPLMLQTGLGIYDLMAGRRSSWRVNPEKLSLLVPNLKQKGLETGFSYQDARADDARLVMRVITEAEREGGVAVNYVKVVELCKNRAGQVCGVAVEDVVGGRTAELQSQVVINASGVWADEICSQLNACPRLRRLRGSHLVFPRWRFPLAQAVGFPHPEDKRPVYVIPWEGVTLLGTTDLDHELTLDQEPYILPGEGEYLLRGVNNLFPSLDLTPDDVLATFSGVRPVVNTEKKDPSRESREHVIYTKNGLVTVTGGKLTTFGLLAKDTFAIAQKWISGSGKPSGTRKDAELPLTLSPKSSDAKYRRLAGRYGNSAQVMMEEAEQGDLEYIPGTGILWGELRWAAGHEAVVHLDDLLLRRVRLGITFPQGGAHLLNSIRTIVQPALGWSSQRWQKETERYLNIWQQSYSPELLSLRN